MGDKYHRREWSRATGADLLLCCETVVNTLPTLADIAILLGVVRAIFLTATRRMLGTSSDSDTRDLITIVHRMGFAALGVVLGIYGTTRPCSRKRKILAETGIRSI